MNGNLVYGMRFDHNGTVHNDAGPGYGGIVSWNSSQNTIRNNYFVRLENAAPDEGVIHGVYLAHGSSDNLISVNAFRYITVIRSTRATTRTPTTCATTCSTTPG